MSKDGQNHLERRSAKMQGNTNISSLCDFSNSATISTLRRKWKDYNCGPLERTSEQAQGNAKYSLATQSFICSADIANISNHRRMSDQFGLRSNNTKQGNTNIWFPYDFRTVTQQYRVLPIIGGLQHSSERTKQRGNTKYSFKQTQYLRHTLWKNTMRRPDTFESSRSIQENRGLCSFLDSMTFSSQPVGNCGASPFNRKTCKDDRAILKNFRAAQDLYLGQDNFSLWGTFLCGRIVPGNVNQRV